MSERYKEMTEHIQQANERIRYAVSHNTSLMAEMEKLRRTCSAYEENSRVLEFEIAKIKEERTKEVGARAKEVGARAKEVDALQMRMQGRDTRINKLESEVKSWEHCYQSGQDD